MSRLHLAISCSLAGTQFAGTQVLPFVLAGALLGAGASTCTAAPAATSSPRASANAPEKTAPLAAGKPSAEKISVVEWPADARISLSLHRVSLSTLLSLLSVQSGVRFRLAVIPDVEISVTLQNALLRQAVPDLLAVHGFALRAGPDAFWLVPAASRRATSLASARAVAQDWRWWTSASAPPTRWMVPGSTDSTSNGEPPAFESVPSESGVPGVAPYGVRVRLQPPPPALSRWRSSVHKFDMALPGVLPAPGATALSPSSTSTSPSTSSASAIRWCARWPVVLRSVPTRCVLVIESARPANFYVNGARLLRSWSGRRTLDLSQSLLPGANLLAIEWLPLETSGASTSPSTSGTPSSTSPRPAFSEAPPRLRYEWIVSQEGLR